MRTSTSRQPRLDGLGPLLARVASGALAIRVAGAGLTFAAQVALARILGPTDFGIYVYILAWVSVLAMATPLGFDTVVLRFTASYRARQLWPNLQGVLRTAFLVGLASGGLIAAAAVGIVPFLFELTEEGLMTTFWIGACMVAPITAVNALRASALRGLGGYVRADVPETIVRPISLLLLLGGYHIWSADTAGAPVAMFLTAVAGLATLVLGLVWLWQLLPPDARHARPAYHIPLWFRTAMPMLLLAGIYILLSRADVIMLGYLLGPEPAGTYAAASRIAELMLFGVAAANTIVPPMIAEFHTTGQQRELQRMVTLAVRGIAVFSLVTACILGFAGEWLLGLFGQTFTGAYPALLLLLVGHALNGLCGPAGFMLTMTGRQGVAASIAGTAALLNIALNLALIPVYGIVGAALATVAATMFWNISMAVYVRAKLSVNATVLARLEA